MEEEKVKDERAPCSAEARPGPEFDCRDCCRGETIIDDCLLSVGGREFPRASGDWGRCPGIMVNGKFKKRSHAFMHEKQPHQLPFLTLEVLSLRNRG